MKKWLTVILLSGLAVNGIQAQFRPPAVDKSPMDMSYYPANYPVLKIQNKVAEPLVARVMYSRPQKNGRAVFGELVEYGKVWRLGANEATEIEFFKDVKVGETKLKKGRYTLYAIPTTEKWTVIFNRETDIWGAFQYDEKKDVCRVDVKPTKQADPVEAFTIVFEKTEEGANMIISWDNVVSVLPIVFSK